MFSISGPRLTFSSLVIASVLDKSVNWYITSNDKAGNLLRSGLLSSDQEIISATTSMVSMLQDHIGELNQ